MLPMIQPLQVIDITAESMAYFYVPVVLKSAAPYWTRFEYLQNLSNLEK